MKIHMKLYEAYHGPIKILQKLQLGPKLSHFKVNPPEHVMHASSLNRFICNSLSYQDVIWYVQDTESYLFASKGSYRSKDLTESANPNQNKNMCTQEHLMWQEHWTGNYWSTLPENGHQDVDIGQRDNPSREYQHPSLLMEGPIWYKIISRNIEHTKT